MEIFRRAHDHKGCAFVEIYQNCNVFNDGAFEQVTSREARPQMLIPLEDGQPIRFGPDGARGVVLDGQGRAKIVDVADVGEDKILVHDEKREEPRAHGSLQPVPENGHPGPVTGGIDRRTRTVGARRLRARGVGLEEC
jgi:2-oxoglutarate ferredoxin oxidoreductase subunit beta